MVKSAIFGTKIWLKNFGRSEQEKNHDFSDNFGKNCFKKMPVQIFLESVRPYFFFLDFSFFFKILVSMATEQYTQESVRYIIRVLRNMWFKVGLDTVHIRCAKSPPKKPQETCTIQEGMSCSIDGLVALISSIDTSFHMD